MRVALRPTGRTRRTSRGLFPARRVLVAMCLFALCRIAAAQPPPSTPAHSSMAWSDFVEPGFPFFSSVLDARRVQVGSITNNLTARGLILNLGQGAWVCFDIDLLRVAAIWRGDAVTPVSMSQGSYHVPGRKAPEGEAELPQMRGEPWLVNGLYPGWETGEILSRIDPRPAGSAPQDLCRGPLPKSMGRFRAVRLVDSGLRLDYEIAGQPVSEFMTAGQAPGTTNLTVTRKIHVERLRKATALSIGFLAPGLTASLSSDTPAIASIQVSSSGLWTVVLKPASTPLEVGVQIHPAGGRPDEDELDRGVMSEGAPPARWQKTIVTKAELGTSLPGQAYVVDHIGLPLTNPWRRNVRIADLTFLEGNRVAVVTFDGDVWIVSGTDGDLREFRWRRFTTGLHEPLGLCARDGELFVHDRNGIWRIRDRDGNGEADIHELFCNSFVQTAETREFASGLRVLPGGAFVIAKGGQRGSTLAPHSGSILQVSADGERVEVLAHGLRQPFIGVHPASGLITTSDQQGHYVPATPLKIIEENRYHGFLPLFLSEDRQTESIVEPLTWIPHPINPSAAGQVWATDSRFGPLSGALLHLGYYRPEVFRVCLNDRGSRKQAAVVSITRDLRFPLLAGAVNPVDGQVYLAGFQIWGTTAPDISGLARLRYTGGASSLLRELVPMREGVLLRFDDAVDAVEASNPANYSAERWNYRRTANYGSPHFKLDGSKGQESLSPSAAYPSADGRTVFVAIPDMRPVMQMRIGWSLSSRTGNRFSQSAYFTPCELSPLDPEAEGLGRISVDLTPRRAVKQEVAPVSADEGQRLSEMMGCVACHSIDGSTLGRVGPSWKGLYGARRRFGDRTEVTADADYLRESIRMPSLKVVEGFETSDTGMPSYEGVLTDPQIESLILYIETLR